MAGFVIISVTNNGKRSREEIISSKVFHSSDDAEKAARQRDENSTSYFYVAPIGKWQPI